MDKSSGESYVLCWRKGGGGCDIDDPEVTNLKPTKTKTKVTYKRKNFVQQLIIHKIEEAYLPNSLRDLF